MTEGADAAGHLEREVKLGAWPGFTVPDLTGVLPWVHAGAVTETRLDATYHDTSDLRLVRWGITVRYRAGGGEDHWTVKLPADGDAVPDGGLARTEFDVEGPPDHVPEEVTDLLRAFVRTASLVPVAQLQTQRRTQRLLDGGGRVVGTVDDDEVSVLEGDRVAARFREVEAEIGPTVSPTLLAAVVGRLRQAGAGSPDPTPKLVRALGPRALAQAEVVVGDVDNDPSVGAVVQAAIASAVLRILGHDTQVRLDAGPEGVHQARVGTRRLRSDLRTFGPVLEEGWADGLRAELKWLAGELGKVRDADVLRQRVRDAVDRLPPGDRGPAGPLLDRLDRERAAVLAELKVDMVSPRYAQLLDHLVDAAGSPHLTPPAEQPAKDVLPKLVRRPWRKLRRQVAETGDDAPDEALHEVRIRAKRARYAAEAAAPAIGAAARHGKAIAGVQSVLGDHHDALVAEAWLREAAAGLPAESAVVAGLLIAAQRADAATGRAEWAEAWEAASRQKLASWL